MNRSGYSDGWDEGVAMWRGVIASATRGKRGQRFFRDLVGALDAMPAKRLIANAIQTTEGDVCALGAIGRHVGRDPAPLDKAVNNEDFEALGEAFDIASQLAQEVMWENDEAGPWRGDETPEQRWVRVRKWAASQIRVTPEELA